MKRKFLLFCALVLTLTLLTACGGGSGAFGGNSTPASDSRETSSPAAQPSKPETGSPEPEEDASGTASQKPAQAESSHILIAWFSVPEDVDTVDAVAGASIMVRDGETLGNTEYVARLIQQATGGDLFRLETEQEYPLDHDLLVEFAAEEKDAGARLALKNLPETLEQYDTIFWAIPTGGPTCQCRFTPFWKAAICAAKPSSRL